MGRRRGQLPKSEFWTKNLSGAASPEVFKDAQQKWMEQLETLAASFSEAMSTEAYSSMLGKAIEQGLTWQDKTPAAKGRARTTGDAAGVTA